MKLIKLSNGKGVSVMVDDEDFEWLNDLRGWVLTATQTVQLRKFKNGKGIYLNMARMIMMLPPGKKAGHELTIDHIDGNRLNNQKSNLKVCSIGENVRNPKTQSGWKTGTRSVWGHKKPFVPPMPCG